MADEALPIRLQSSGVSRAEIREIQVALREAGLIATGDRSLTSLVQQLRGGRPAPIRLVGMSSDKAEGLGGEGHLFEALAVAGPWIMVLAVPALQGFFNSLAKKGAEEGGQAAYAGCKKVISRIFATRKRRSRQRQLLEVRDEQAGIYVRFEPGLSDEAYRSLFSDILPLLKTDQRCVLIYDADSGKWDMTVLPKADT